MSQSKIAMVISASGLFLVFFIALLIYQLNGPENFSDLFKDSAQAEMNTKISQQNLAQNKNGPQEFVVPQIKTLKPSPLTESIMRGKDYLENTHQLLPQYVGAKMNCTSCHLNSGTTPNAGPWVGITTKFPQYRSRSAKVDTLPDRVNDCFERSLNGKRLPLESSQMTDIISYMTFLSTGYEVGREIVGSGMPKLKLETPPDLINGTKVYQQKCVMCHQAGGEGLYSEDKKIIYPALWGSSSFNVGAGMARLHTAAGFVKKNMPLGQGNTLTDKEAWDVAAYFTQQKRPDFAKKMKDWLKGEKPTDARY